MKTGYWVVRTYQAGSVGEKTKFWVRGDRPERSSRKEKSEIKKQEQNEHSSEKRLARLINANCGVGWMLVTLDYSPEGLDRLIAGALSMGMDQDSEDEVKKMEFIRLAAEHQQELFLRRVKRELAKTGKSLKYIAITSDMDGDTGESVRIHHHMIVSIEAKEALAAKWKDLGVIDWKPLFTQVDYTPIAAYFMRQVRRVPDAKKYITSRKLVRPEPKDRAVNSDAELRVPRGGELLHRNEYKPGRPQYIRYALPTAGRPILPGGGTPDIPPR